MHSDTNASLTNATTSNGIQATSGKARISIKKAYLCLLSFPHSYGKGCRNGVDTAKLVLNSFFS